MIKLFARISAVPAILVACLLIILSGCFAPVQEGFAIYLTRDDIPPARMEVLSRVDITEQPVIAINDIVAYDATTHEITLTAGAYDRISSLDVPVRGRSFLVCVDRKPIYWGAFWTPLSSQSFDGITIWKPLGPRDPKVIKLELGYPSPSFYGGEDPRDNAEVMKSLEQAGKLNVSSAAAGKLPNSMKGYELYSWMADDQWHFTLITGTNRNKTYEEVISNANIVSEDGWVQIHVTGMDEFKTVLSRLPQGEDIFWLSSLRTDQAQKGSISIMLPPETITDDIKNHAGQCGLNLVVEKH